MANSFELQIREFENMTAERSELLFKKVCFDLSNSIIMDTAVLSGAARGRWAPDINKIDNSTDEVFDKSKHTFLKSFSLFSVVIFSNSFNCNSKLLAIRY